MTISLITMDSAIVGLDRKLVKQNRREAIHTARPSPPPPFAIQGYQPGMNRPTPYQPTESRRKPFKTQLLKWVGNKQRFAHEITGCFPRDYHRYLEPFLGSGAVLATLAPAHGIASDVYEPVIEIFRTLKDDPALLKSWYRQRWSIAHGDSKVCGFETIRDHFNRHPNGADLLFLCRACYGGVVRFRKKDGHMSTPCGAHEPIHPDSFDSRVDLWHERVKNTDFLAGDYREIMQRARAGDLVYCDPPYSDSQSILYGGQAFRLHDLMDAIADCKDRGVYVALSIDGTKKSGRRICDLAIPPGLFEQEMFVNVGRSMLKRFQMEGLTLENEMVSDRLLLTYPLPSSG